MLFLQKKLVDRRFIFFPLIPLLFSSVVLAAPACPLSNPKYKNLSDAVTALASKIKLPSQCAAKQAAMQEALDTLSKSADQMITLGSSDNQDSEKKGKESALTAVSSLNTINTSLRDDCGKTLLTSGDFMNAFIDTVNAVTPYIMVFGGATAAPWAMGTMVTGSAIKTIFQYFAKTGIDMNKTDQRRAFIESSCGYYTLNETVRALIQAQQTDNTDSKKNLLDAENQLKTLLGSEPILPNEPIFSAQAETLVDIEKLKVLRTSLEAVKENGYYCFAIQQKTITGEFTPAGQRLLTLLSGDNSPSSANDQALVNYFKMKLNMPLVYDEPKLENCPTKANIWTNTLEKILLKTMARIDSLVKDRSVVQIHKKWQEQVDKKKKEISDYKLREKFLMDIMASGAQVETSEILSSLNEVRDILFGGRGWGRESLSQSWVRFKLRMSESRLDSFKKQQRIFFEQAVTTPTDGGQLADLCAQGEQARNSWYSAEVHVKAAREYCLAFDTTINKYDFGGLQRTCFESENASVHSQRERVAQFKDEAGLIKDRMRTLGCKRPEFLINSLY